MVVLHHLPASAHRRMPWKNGGGETIEIAVHPAGAGLADFDWRVSMARVAADGPFSTFPGIDRTLAILSGGGLELDVAGMERRTLTPGSDPFAFPADAPTQTRLLGGAVTDLNVMTRREAFDHRVERIAVEPGGGVSVPPRPALWSLLLAAGACRIETPDRTLRLAAHDALLVEAPPVGLRALAIDGPIVLHAVSISPASMAP